MLLLGGGAVAAGDEATAVAERLGAPIGLTVNAKGVLPDSHPLSLGTTLTLRPVHAAFAEADVVLAVGTEFGETDYFYAPGAAAPHFAGSLVRVDIDSDQLQRQRAAAVGLHGDAAATLAAIDAGLAARGRERSTASDRAAALRDRPHAGGPAPSDSCRSWLRSIAACPRTASSSPTRPSRPTSPITPGPGGRRAATSLPAASARSARPCPWRSERSSRRRGAPWSRWPATAARCSRFPELASAADLGLPIALVIWQNDGYGEMRDSMDRIGAPRMGTEISAHDFMLLAEGFGCRGVRTESLDDLPGALAEAFAADRPTLVEVHS